MKYVLPLLVAVVCALSACKTTANRFDLYAPNKPQGPYTERAHEWNRAWDISGGRGPLTPVYASTTSQPAASQPPEEVPTPPPASPAQRVPETNVGAPAPTPFSALPPSSIPGTNAAATVIPGTSAPVTVPATGSEPLAVPPPAPATTPPVSLAPTPTPVVPGLSQ